MKLFQVLISSVITFSFIFVSRAALGLQIRDVKQIRIVVEGTQSTSSRTIQLKDLPVTHYVSQVDPHRAKNPEKKLAKWGGMEVRGILSKELSKSGDRPVTVTGASGYSSEMSERILREHPVLLATNKDGVPLTPAEGGPQLAFPLADKTLPDRYREESYWVWFVSAFFIGAPRPLLKIGEGPKAISVHLMRDTRGKWIERLTCYPSGHRYTKPPRDKVRISYLPLSELARNATKVTVTSYQGLNTELTGDLSRYQVAFAWNGERIPPLFGGPIQILDRDHIDRCLHFVEKFAPSS